MSNNPLPSDLPIHSFSTAADFESFLEREHATAPGIYLKLAKKSSGFASISGAEAVEVALCYGWIDGRANGLNDKWWLARYTPRRAKSIWSQKNVTTVGRLEDEGRMRPAGLAAVEAAKSDGRWERAYAGPATITVPGDFAAVLATDAAAAAFFETLKKSDRYSVLWRVETASPASRAKRIEALVQMLAVGKKPGEPVQPAIKPKTTSGIRKTALKMSIAKKNGKAREKAEGTTPAQGSEAKQGLRKGLRSRP